MKQRHLILGLTSWLVAIAAGWYVLRAELDSQSSSIVEFSEDVSQWVFRARHSRIAASEMPINIALDDPIFLQTPDGKFVQKGHVSSVDGTRERDPITVKEARIVLYDSATAAFPDGYRLEYHRTPMDLGWVVQMLVPADRQQEIVTLVQNEWSLHQEELIEEFRPVISEGVRRALKAIEAELPAIMERHGDDFRALGERFESDILQEQLVPLAKDEILPVMQEEIEPLAMEIANTLWNRVSLLSFTWRFLYDVSPLPRRNAVKGEFDRFIEEEALPELESRSDDFVEVTKVVITRVLENPRVRDTLRESLVEVAMDSDLQRILLEVIREVSVDNKTLRSEMKDWMSSYRTQAAVKLASGRLETMVRTIGDMVFGTPESGVTPEFARILRSQILRKDRRWFVMIADADVSDGSAVPIVLAEQPMLYPQKFAGQHQSPLTPE